MKEGYTPFYQAQVEEVLWGDCNISPGDYRWDLIAWPHRRDTISLRVGYWEKLQPSQFNLLSKYFDVREDLYEDNDGDSDSGRPIIRKLWSYEFKVKEL